MNVTPIHSWDLTIPEAVKLQKELAKRVDTATPVEKVELVAGADISYDRDSPHFYASVVVLRASDGVVIETADAEVDSHFPYVPGLLSFREAPALLEAFRKVQNRPDVVVIDGQGIAHPRRLGIASHVGLWLDVPTIGCAKSKLYGIYDEPGPNPGDESPLWDRYRKEQLGVVLRTRKNAGPVYISPGNRIDVASSVRIIKSLAGKYRIPEPTRLAHERVNEVRRAGGTGR